MKLIQLLKLSHAEFVARRKTITFSVLAAGVPFIIILTMSLIWHGAGNIFLKYSSRPTDGAVYLAITADKDRDIMKFVGENHGEFLGEVTEEDTDKYETPTEILAAMAGLSAEKLAMAPGETLLDGVEWYEITQVKPIDFALSSMSGYNAPFWDDMVNLQAILKTQRVIFVRFPTVEDAYNYIHTIAEQWKYSSGMPQHAEAFTNLSSTYATYKRGSSLPLAIGLVIAGIIMIGTFVYLLDQELHSVVIYRALGASVKDLLVITLGYLLEIGLAMVIFVLSVSIIGVLIFSGVNASYLGGLLEEFYRVTSPKVLLLGWNMDILWVALTIILAAPVSLLLTLDQFSVKKLSQKLKRD